MNANRLLHDDTYLYEYDENGNRTARIRRADLRRENYQHDRENRLVGYTMSSGSVVLRQARYFYDGLGRRVAKAVDADGAGPAPRCFTPSFMTARTWWSGRRAPGRAAWTAWGRWAR